MGNKRGLAIILLSLVPATIAILVFITLHAWGNWMQSYIGTINPADYPAAAAGPLGAMKDILGPVIVQVGQYMKVVGNFFGTVIGLVAIGVFIRGVMAIRQKNT
ncbi:MAG: hypothetical protein TUN42_05740 [Dehalogenimonas sp.]